MQPLVKQCLNWFSEFFYERMCNVELAWRERLLFLGSGCRITGFGWLEGGSWCLPCT